MGKSASRNNLLQLTTHFLCIIKDEYLMSLTGQLPGCGKTGYTTAYDAHLLASRHSWLIHLSKSRKITQWANLNCLINGATGTAIHTRVRTNTATYRAWEWSVLKLQLNGLLQSALTNQIIAKLGRDASRTAELTRSRILSIIPAWNS